MSEGTCKVFADAPGYEVLGKTPYDQAWIDNQVESGVAGCGWKRPVARPAALDAPPKAVVTAKPKPKKKPLLRRLLGTS